MSYNKSQQGAVAIFVVIFCALFVTIITISFVGIMLKNQEQATNADLADGAYDSALAGVEDAKRLLLKYREAGCSTIDLTTPICKSVNAGLCSSIRTGLYNKTGDLEVKIQSSDTNVNDEKLEQAYTCTRITIGQPYYETSLEINKTTVIPIDVDQDYDKIRLSWFKRGTTPGDDYYSALCNVVAPYTSRLFTTQAAWNGACTPAGAARPPVLRAQFVKLDTDFSLRDFDDANRSRTGSVFLYPYTSSASIANVSILGPVNTPIPTQCKSTLPYACAANLTLSPTVGASRRSYLILSPVYKNTHVKVEVFSGSTPRTFVHVAGVDSTGRANDLFRRVKAQITIDTSSADTATFPSAALEVGSLCKNFGVTASRSEFATYDCSP